MKKSRVDLVQLKAGLGEKLKKKREPLSPADASSSKKKTVEKELIEERSALASFEGEDTSASKKDLPSPAASAALEEVEKVARIK